MTVTPSYLYMLLKMKYSRKYPSFVFNKTGEYKMYFEQTKNKIELPPDYHLCTQYSN